ARATCGRVKTPRRPSTCCSRCWGSNGRSWSSPHGAWRTGCSRSRARCWRISRKSPTPSTRSSSCHASWTCRRPRRRASANAHPPSSHPEFRMNVFWFIPTHGDSRYLGTTQGARAATHDYFRQIAVAADTLGYDGVLLPTGRSCEDAWVVASSLIGATRRLKFLVAVRPGVSSPQFAARMAATFDRMSGGRLLVNVVTGGDPAELEGDGLFASHDERYAITADFLNIWRGILQASHEGGSYSFQGQKLASHGGKVIFPPAQRPYPPLYFGGSSGPAHELAAEQLDVYLTWGEPPAAVAAKLADLRARAARHGRVLKFGIRLHVIVRETEQAAWQAANALISHLDDETVAAAQAAFGRMDS